jgi:hypothetical protein
LSSPPQCAAAIAVRAIDGAIQRRMFMDPPGQETYDRLVAARK